MRLDYIRVIINVVFYLSISSYDENASFTKTLYTVQRDLTLYWSSISRNIYRTGRTLLTLTIIMRVYNEREQLFKIIII